MNDDCIEDFHCVEFFRKIKDEMSAKLNAMTPEERRLYFERIHKAAVQRKQEYDRAREQANSAAT